MALPVIIEDASLARNTIAPMRSWTRLNRPSLIFLSTSALNTASSKNGFVNGVSTNVGQTVLTILGSVARTASDHIATVAADLKPIAHLYKTQVYAMARHLGIPEEICAAAPTTDTYSLQQGQDEFYFALSYDKMDVALWAFNHGVPDAELALFLKMSQEQAAFIYKDIVAKRHATRYLHSAPVLVEPVAEISTG